MYFYKIYGLMVKSEIILNELEVCDQNDRIDINICYGRVPKDIDEAKCINEYVKASKREFCLYIKNVANYYVTDGNTIIVDAKSNCDSEEVKIYLLGTCIGMLLSQRNTVVLHGGAVAIDGYGIIVTGQSGAGKSTLTNALRRKDGYSFLSDDVSPLECNLNGEVKVYSSYARQKLCIDAMESFGYSTMDYTLVDQTRQKYEIRLQDKVLIEKAPLKAIYEIEAVEDINEVQIEQLYGNKKMQNILHNIYRGEVISCIGFEPNYFKKCIEVAKCIKVFKIKRPKNGYTMEQQIEVIENSLRQI